jgi:hypothetical protein
MPRSAKNISVRQLQAAVQTALEATQKAHPGTDLKPADPTIPLPVIYWPWWICGLPLPWPVDDLNKVVELTATFTTNLAKDPTVAPLAVEGKFIPAVIVTGGSISVGFAPGEATLTP